MRISPESWRFKVNHCSTILLNFIHRQVKQKPHWYYILCHCFFFFLHLCFLFILFCSTTLLSSLKCRSMPLSLCLSEFLPADELWRMFVFFKASSVRNWTHKVRRGGLISLHIPCLHLTHVHIHVFCKQTNNLHCHQMHVSTLVTKPAELVLPHKYSICSIKASARVIIHCIYRFYHHDRHNSAPSCSLCNDKNNNLVVVYSVCAINEIN